MFIELLEGRRLFCQSVEIGPEMEEKSEEEMLCKYPAGQGNAPVCLVQLDGDAAPEAVITPGGTHTASPNW